MLAPADLARLRTDRARFDPSLWADVDYPEGDGVLVLRSGDDGGTWQPAYFAPSVDWFDPALNRWREAGPPHAVSLQATPEALHLVALTRYAGFVGPVGAAYDGSRWRDAASLPYDRAADDRLALGGSVLVPTERGPLLLAYQIRPAAGTVGTLVATLSSLFSGGRYREPMRLAAADARSGARAASCALSPPDRRVTAFQAVGTASGRAHVLWLDASLDTQAPAYRLRYASAPASECGSRTDS